MFHSDVKEYRLDSVPLDQSIYKRDDGEYLVQRDHSSLAQVPPPTRAYPPPVYTSYSKVPAPRMSVSTFNRKDERWWEKVFSCCRSEKEVAAEFEDCDYCQRRVYGRGEEPEEEGPYISPLRMLQRQRQPVNTFSDRLHNNELIKDNWQSR